MERIRLIITGGTFDKQYDEIRGELTFKDSHLPEILRIVRCSTPVELEINQLTDSLDMTEKGRLSILESCERSPEKKILIIHGTDTLTLTASLLGKQLQNKTVVFTGAFVPYTVQKSDSLFNLGTAFGALPFLQKGVYVAMNGSVYPWNRVQKDRIKGRFAGDPF